MSIRASEKLKDHAVPKQPLKCLSPDQIPCQARVSCTKVPIPKAKVCCKQCNAYQCKVCDRQIHKSTSEIHERTKLSEPVTVVSCQSKRCREHLKAQVYCTVCRKCYCSKCDGLRHSAPDHAHHARFSMNGELEAVVDSDCPRSIEDMLSLVSLDADDTDSILSDRSCSKLPDVPVHTVERKGRIVDRSEHEDDEEDNDDVYTLSVIKGLACFRRSFLLVNDKEVLQVKTAQEFVVRLGCQQSSLVKIVSIFGNTGEGKSHTLNHAFFKGSEVFQTSAAQASCTLGVWAAYDGVLQVIVIDTEGLLGVSANQNQRTRLLLKVMAISDLIIYRTRAERLHNDLFQFLGDASRAYTGHFQKELKAASERCGFDGNLSQLGPAVVIFHETQHTDIMKSDRRMGDCSCQLKKRFQELNYSYDAFSGVDYVGTRTISGATAFDGLVKTVRKHLNNSTVRSTRQPAIVFQALQVLNNKFSGNIAKADSETFPDQYFTCSGKCLSCGVRCQNSMNHHQENIPHSASTKCRYQHQLDNRVFICKVCHENGRTSTILPKTYSSDDSTWMGLAKYAWSGYVLECSHCGITYRSRQYWYGNRDPVETVVRTEIQHVWPGGNPSPSGNQNAAQKMLDGVTYISNTVTSYSAAPTKVLTSWMADCIAPPYWKPNSEILKCHHCGETFAPTDTKHHCRACGNGFCEECSNYFRPVPERGWGAAPVRVCKNCNDRKEVDADEPMEPKEVMARRVGEILHGTIGTVVSAIDYPLGMIKYSARPAYWIPDEDLIECHVCHATFSTKIPKHHCRGCGQGVCDECSPQSKPVPSRGWEQPVRVCKTCADQGDL